VHSQAENFTMHARWDFEATKPEQYPLLLHFPYFDLYRKQVVKQADLVLAMFLRGDAFTAEEKARNFAYYEPLTVRDSSLSACTQSVIAAEVGHLDLAYDYFAEAALMDLDDLEHNTRDGVHIASLAGACIAAVSGFGGMRDHDGHLSFIPRLPGALSRLCFRLMFRGRHLRVEIEHDRARYSLSDGKALDVRHHGETLTIKPGATVERAIPPAPALERPRQPPGREPARRRNPSQDREWGLGATQPIRHLIGPSPGKCSAWAVAPVRSHTRPAMYGPRSSTGTRIARPPYTNVTIVPHGSVLFATPSCGTWSTPPQAIGNP
jgi:alpha,alpha-trehalose phosphorylase